MSDQPLDFDLKFLPDWLKEPAGKNPYADFEGERPRRSGPRRDDGGFRSGPRPSGPRSSGPRSGGGGGPRSSGPRPSGPRSGGPGQRDGRPPRKDGGRPEQRRNHPAGPRPAPQQPAAPAQPPVPLQIEFLPEEESIAALIQQIKTGHRAFPLYGVGRMFLNKPERHRVRITSLAPACPVYAVGESATLNRAQAEREAFRALRANYYTEETTEVEPPKGNFASVARCRLSGVLLGPTNHHGYQPALRRLYDARFSRRSSYPEFLRQIEVVNDPAVVEAWKQEISKTTVYRTTQEAEPKEFKTLAEVEAHFRATYLESAIKGDKSVTIGGVASRSVNDRAIREAIRATWEKERTFPAQLVNLMRPHFTSANLQIWKHRKRILFISEVRPVRFGPEARSVSEPIANLLNIIEASPKCTRADLSAQLLKPRENDPEYQQLKAALAADLRWLIQAGHVIEFHDGTFDLPLPPKEAAREAASPQQEAEQTSQEPVATEEPVAATEEVAAQEPESVTAEPVIAEAVPTEGSDPEHPPVDEVATTPAADPAPAAPTASSEPQ